MLTSAQAASLQEAIDTFGDQGGDLSTMVGPLVAESPEFGTVLMHGRTLDRHYDDVEDHQHGLIYYGVCRADGAWSPGVIQDDFSEVMCSIMTGVTWDDGRPITPEDWDNTVEVAPDFLPDDLI